MKAVRVAGAMALMAVLLIFTAVWITDGWSISERLVATAGLLALLAFFTVITADAD